MKIYLDFIFLLNFGFDFILLLTVNIVLKRNKKISDIIAGSLIGSLSIFILFLKISSLTLFFMKIIISIIMIFITFGYRDIRYTVRNFIYLYTVSMILGGFLYFLNNQFSYKQKGLVFYHNGLSVNLLFLVITSPIIVYIYIKQAQFMKNNYNHYYTVILKHNGKKVCLTAFLDTGNHMVEPLSKKPVLLIDKRKFIFDINEFKMILVPVITVSSTSLMKCVKFSEVEIKNVGIRDIYIGLMDESVPIDGIDCILSEKILEGINC